MERRDDDTQAWRYDLVTPTADLSMNRAAVRYPKLVESVGTDGRFVGAIRPFPGFADSTIHGIGDIFPNNEVEYIKYVAVQKGLKGVSVGGLVAFCRDTGDAQDTQKRQLVFTGWDQENEVSYRVALDQTWRWGTGASSYYKPDSGTWGSVDVSHSDRYIYFVGTPKFSGSPEVYMPFNRAYSWDFKANAWDPSIPDFFSRSMGLFYAGQTAPAEYDPADDDGTRVLPTSYPFGARPNSDSVLRAGAKYQFGAALISRKHNLRSKIALTRSYTATDNIKHCIRVQKGGTYTYTPQQYVFDDEIQKYWGMPHYDAVRIYQTLGFDDNDPVTGWQAIGTLYLENPAVDISSTDEDYIHRDSYGMYYWVGKDFEDYVLAGQAERYDSYLDEVNPMPRAKLVCHHDGMTVIVTNAYEKANPDLNWFEGNWIEESIRWSNVARGEPENFPVANVYRKSSAGEKYLALEPVGDYIFAISTGGVYRIARSGGSVGVNKIGSSLGGVSRYAQTAVGNLLYVLTPAGLKQVDANTGDIQNVPVADRVIFDERRWANSLSSVSMEYDATCGCLILLNTTKKEAILLWDSTGSVTTLEDCPWSFLASGEDVKNRGNRRVYWVTSGGKVHCIDSFREMPKRTMFGASGSDLVNGTVSSSTSTKITATDGGIPSAAVGFKVYVRHADGTWEDRWITATTDTTITVGEAFTLAPANGDTFSVGPVKVRVTLPHVTSEMGADPFCRKKITQIGVALTETGGETSAARVVVGVENRTTDMGYSDRLFDEVPDKTFARVGTAGVQLYPYVEVATANVDFELQSVLVHGSTTGSEAESRQG